MRKAFVLSPISVGFLFAIASAALFAVRPIFVKLVYAQGIDSLTLIAYRMLFSAPFYLFMLSMLLRDVETRAKLNFKRLARCCVIGIMGYCVASYLDLLGLQYVTAQLGRMVLYIYPTFVVLLGALLLGHKITWRIVIPLGITYLGVAIIFGHDLQEFGNDVIKGTLYITGSALAFSFYLLLSKDLITAIGSRLFTSIALLAASGAIFILYLFTMSDGPTHTTPIGLFWILIIAIFCTVIPTFFTASAVARIGADRAGIVGLIGPGFTSVFAVLILAEQFTVYHAAGIVLTIIGVWVLRKVSNA